jgi:capsular exopolysaccharide synthesis family protein
MRRENGTLIDSKLRILMSQNPVNPVPAAPRSSVAGSEGPDLLFVLRHYVWLIVIGTLVGLAVGAGLWLTLRKFYPKYRAEARFNVLDTSKLSPLDQKNFAPETEMLQFIRTQTKLIKQREFYEQVFKVKEVAESQWYNRFKNNQTAANQALDDALSADGVANTSLMQFSLTIPDREEVDVLLNKICEQYIAWVDSIAAKQREQDIRAFREQLNSAEKNLTRAQTDADDFRSLHDVGAVAKTLDVANSALLDFERELNKLTIDQKLMQVAVDQVTEAQKDPNYKLPTEYQQSIERDPTYRSLDDTRMAYERERDVAIKMYDRFHPTVRQYDLKIEAVVKQLAGVRVVAEARAKEMQLSSVTAALSSINSRILDVKKKHDEKQAEIRKLDGDLVAYKSRSDAVDAARAQFNIAQAEYNKQDQILRSQQSRVQFVGRARPQNPEDIASPTLTTYLPAGLLLGLLVSFAIAYLLEMTNKRVRTPRDITKTMQLPLLGFVPDQGDDDMLHGDLATTIRTAPSSMTAESFRQIRGRLAALSENNSMRMVLVASISPDGGATTVASNLANGLALNGRRVLLVDANFYRPGLKQVYRNMAAVGFSDLLLDSNKLDASIVPAADMPNLFLMSAGTKTTGSSELLETQGCSELLLKLKGMFDIVIFDGAPLSLVSDSVSLAAKVDGVIAVVRAGRITRGTVQRVREQLRQVRANFLGVILNAAQAQSAGYFRENYRSFYRYANGSIGGTNGHPQAPAPRPPQQQTN